jgi:hypothetical protein
LVAREAPMPAMLMLPLVRWALALMEIPLQPL